MRLDTDAERANLSGLSNSEVAGASWSDFGAVIVVRKLDDAIALVDQLAPEHLEILADDPERLVKQIHNAGAIFIGAHTPEAIGDYVAGSNHVLPTARSARFSSGLGVLDFMKRTSLLKCGPEQLRALIIADMPFLSFQPSIETAIISAGRFLKEGNAEGVKRTSVPPR